MHYKDGSLIKRFDREGHNKKLETEDFAQLLQASRDSKYSSSVEQVGAVIERYCTFPALHHNDFAKLLAELSQGWVAFAQ